MRIKTRTSPGVKILDRQQNKIQFSVFAYNRKKVELVYRAASDKEDSLSSLSSLPSLPSVPSLPSLPMEETSPHLFTITTHLPYLQPLYAYKLDGKGPFPDPYSHYQPEGVHGFSRVVDHGVYQWNEAGWKGAELKDLLIYEIHPGTFTPEGTFRGVVSRLDYLQELGVNAVELMPATQTPGRWNWGYDGVNLFSVNHRYGTPEELKFLVEECHRRGLAVILDVVYNHFGPEGTYLREFGPYFTAKHETPWGEAVNYDDAYCNMARQMVLDSVSHWLETYRFDGLRLDAVHAIQDTSSPHLLEEISKTAEEAAQRWGRHKWVIAETDENDVRLITPKEKGGYGIHAQWMDDFHHCVHTILTGENRGYYKDYGRFKDLEKVFNNYLYTGEYSRFWEKRRGTDGSRCPGYRFVVAVQTHDQVGNRAGGERLSHLIEYPHLKAAATLLFLSPYLPLLFMGEEYGEENPFLFFTDYGDPKLQEAVSKGRLKEFKDFGWEKVPDPQEEQTFYASRLTEKDSWHPRQEKLFRFYRDLIYLRRTHPALREPEKSRTRVKADPHSRVVEITRWNKEGRTLLGKCNLGHKTLVLPPLTGKVILGSEWEKYGGSKKETNTHHLLQKGEAILEEKGVF